MDGRIISLIGCAMMFIGIAWSLSNSMGNINQAQSEVDEAQRDVDQTQREVDVALADCLDKAGYMACEEVSLNSCMNHGRSHEQCFLEWREDYNRVSGA